MRPRILCFLLVLIASPLPALAQSHHVNTDCEIGYRRCVMQARHGGGENNPCADYSACQAAKQCEAARCACKRSGGSDDPALQQEAGMMCNAVLRPHGSNVCDRYIKPCQAWSEAQHQKPDTPPPAASGGPQTLIRPDQLPR